MANSARHTPILSPASPVGTPGPLREQLLMSETVRRMHDREFTALVADLRTDLTTAAARYLRSN